MEVKKHPEFLVKDSNLFFKFILSESKNNTDTQTLLVFEAKYNHEDIRKKIEEILKKPQKSDMIASGALTRVNSRCSFEATIGSDTLVHERGKLKRDIVKKMEKIIADVFNNSLTK